MTKLPLVIVATAALGAGGWYGFQQYKTVQARQAEKTRVAAVEAKQRATAAAEAKQRADAAAAEAKQRATAAAAIAATRKEVESQLKPMKVSSIMLGEPALVIIDKKEYAEGDKLTLPGGGKQLQIARVSEDGVLLAYNGLTFRLDPPAAPDLAASRKK